MFPMSLIGRFLSARQRRAFPVAAADVVVKIDLLPSGESRRLAFLLLAAGGGG